MSLLARVAKKAITSTAIFVTKRIAAKVASKLTGAAIRKKMGS